MSKYTVITIADQAIVGHRARKDAAIKLGDSTGQGYKVLSPTGGVVHVVLATEAPADEQGTEEQADEAQADAAQEDLIGDVADEQPAPEASTKFDIDQMKDKIAKLLAKAEGTDNEDEREAFTAKAEKLMLKLGIDAAELEAAGEVKPEEIIEVRREYKGGYALTFVSFVHAVANGWGNVTVLQSGRGSVRYAYIIGHKSDVEMLTQLITSLELQAMSALHVWQKTEPSRQYQDNNARYVGSRSFLEAYGRTVGNRLFKLRQQAETEATTGAALVLASKQSRVDDYMGQAYPKLGKARGGNRRYSAIAGAAGREAGNRADIGGKRVQGGAKGSLKA